MQNRKWGFDIGGVIIDRANDGTDTSFFSDNYLRTTQMRGAFHALNRVRQEVGAENVFVVSKCSPAIERKSRAWLVHMNFYGLTGIRETNVRFCRTREGKAPICAELGITNFVDDKLEVLSYLETVSTRFLFRPKAEEVGLYRQHLGGVIRVESWREFLQIVLP